MQLQTTSPESKFPNEYSDVIFIQIDQHLKKLLQKYKWVPILWITVYILRVDYCWDHTGHGCLTLPETLVFLKCNSAALGHVSPLN